MCVNDVVHKEPDPEDVTVFSFVSREGQPCMWQIGRLLDALMEGHDIFSSPLNSQTDTSDSVVVLQILAVGQTHTGRGLAAKLIRSTEEVTRLAGLKTVISEATSHFSSRAFLRAGFQAVRRIQYADFTLDADDGHRRPFRLLGQRTIHTGADLMVKRLS